MSFADLIVTFIYSTFGESLAYPIIINFLFLLTGLFIFFMLRFYLFIIAILDYIKKTLRLFPKHSLFIFPENWL